MSSSIDVDDAAKAIILLFDMFANESGNIGEWIEELSEDYPALADAVFKACSNAE